MLELKGALTQIIFSKKYNLFFKEILIEPIKAKSNKHEKNKYMINKGLWSTPAEKNYIF